MKWTVKLLGKGKVGSKENIKVAGVVLVLAPTFMLRVRV
jgi:hypothetical protein